MNWRTFWEVVEILENVFFRSSAYMLVVVDKPKPFFLSSALKLIIWSYWIFARHFFKVLSINIGMVVDELKKFFSSSVFKPIIWGCVRSEDLFLCPQILCAKPNKDGNKYFALVNPKVNGNLYLKAAKRAFFVSNKLSDVANRMVEP